MIKTLTCEQIFQQNKIIPVIILNDVTKAIPIARAFLAGGINCIEITLRTPKALSIIKHLTQEVPEMIIGAGTVITSHLYQMAIEHGAQFIVSPGITDYLIQTSHDYEVPLLPGAVTPTEVMQAMDHGFNYLKFFPAEAYNGYKVLQSLVSPFPTVKFCPTGGINLLNLKQHMSLSNVVGVGSSFLLQQSWIENNEFNKITLATQEALSLIK